MPTTPEEARAIEDFVRDFVLPRYARIHREMRKGRGEGPDDLVSDFLQLVPDAAPLVVRGLAASGDRHLREDAATELSLTPLDQQTLFDVAQQLVVDPHRSIVREAYWNAVSVRGEGALSPEQIATIDAAVGVPPRQL